MSSGYDSVPVTIYLNQYMLQQGPNAATSQRGCSPSALAGMRIPILAFATLLIRC